MSEDPFGFLAAINWDAVDEHADEIAKILGIEEGRDYEHTHYSVIDGSPAMRVRSDLDTITLVNEDGYVWTDPVEQWKEIPR